MQSLQSSNYRLIIALQAPACKGLDVTVEAYLKHKLGPQKHAVLQLRPHSSVHARALATIHKGQSTKIIQAQSAQTSFPDQQHVSWERDTTQVSSEQMLHRLG